MACFTASLPTDANPSAAYLLGGGVSATFQHISDVACTCYFLLCFFCLVFCRCLVYLCHSQNQARFLVHFFVVSVATRALTNCVPRFCFLFLLPFAFSVYIYILALLLVVLACFQMGFYFVTTGWIFEMGLCENSINQSVYFQFFKT